MKKDKRLIRILKIVKTLYEGKRVFTRELAYKAGSSQRTAQRDMAALEASGFAIFNKPIGRRCLWYWEKVK